jgi:hypothetical protein
VLNRLAFSGYDGRVGLEYRPVGRARRASAGCPGSCGLPGRPSDDHGRNGRAGDHGHADGGEPGRGGYRVLGHDLSPQRVAQLVRSAGRPPVGRRGARAIW